MRRPCMPLVSRAMLLLVLLPAVAGGDEITPGIEILNGVYASLPDEDLEALKRTVGDAPVVALGESVHTSGGYSRMKYRIFRYMVEEMGFRAFAFESSWDRAESVAEYVQTCAGEPEQVLRGLYGVWRNESVRDLVKWMCVWNHRHPDDPVFFLGFDVQQPDRDLRALKDYLRLFGLPDSDIRIQGLERCSKKTTEPFYFQSDFDECIKRLDQLARYFDRRQENIIRRTSAEDLEWARLRWLGFRAWQVQKYHTNRDDLQDTAARDEAMAEVFLRRRQLQFRDVKTAIWAHNFHISQDSLASQGVASLGDHLDEALGEDYIAFGLIGYSVSVNFFNGICSELPRPTRSDALEVMLHDLGEPYLFVDLDFPGTSSPFLEASRHYSVSGEWVVPREHYDGLVFLDVSPRMKSLSWPNCE